MNTTKLPWDFCPQLMETRLKAIANLLIYSRKKCFERYDYESGDTPWSSGCCARDWGRQALRKAEEDNDNYPYLNIIEDIGQRFVFAIAGIPVKFFKEDAASPTARVARRSPVESYQMSLFAHAGMDLPQEISWRLLINHDYYEPEVMTATFVGLDPNGNIECLYHIPVEDNVIDIYELLPDAEEGVELGAPPVGKKKEKFKEAVND